MSLGCKAPLLESIGRLNQNTVLGPSAVPVTWLVKIKIYSAYTCMYLTFFEYRQMLDIFLHV